jgi:peptidylprolyl isomerase
MNNNEQGNDGSAKAHLDHVTETKKPVGQRVKPLYLMIAVVLVVVVVTGIYFAVNASAQVVAVGDTINVSYTGSLTNGTVFDTNVGGKQLQFIVGAGQLIRGFDQGVVGMRLGDEKKITVPEDEAYGPVNQSLIMQFPSNMLGNRTAAVGTEVYTVIRGQQVPGIVTAINETTVTADFNPMLAGKALIFDIKILAIRKA